MCKSLLTVQLSTVSTVRLLFYSFHCHCICQFTAHMPVSLKVPCACDIQEFAVSTSDTYGPSDNLNMNITNLTLIHVTLLTVYLNIFTYYQHPPDNLLLLPIGQFTPIVQLITYSYYPPDNLLMLST